MTSETADLFRRLTRGAYVIGVAHEAQREVFAATSVMLASRRPLLLAVGVDPRHAFYPLMRAGRLFAVSVLRQDQIESVRRFGAQSPDGGGNPAGISWRCGRGGAPIVDDALAYFECEMSAVMPSGDHEIIVGRVVDCRIPDGRGTATVYPMGADANRGAGMPMQRFPAP